MNKIEELYKKALGIYKKNKMPILYIVFGALTTLVNVLIYSLCFYSLGLSNEISVVISWVISVLFAYITNKIYVFESKSKKPKKLIYEISTFFGCRAATGLLDFGIMYLSVNILTLQPVVMKILSNILVIILNYLFSKIMIFKK